MTTGCVRFSNRSSTRARLLGVSDAEVNWAFEEMESAFERGRSFRSETEPIDVEGLTLPTISYVICATFRTGSTLLKDWLASTGILGRPDEHCNPGERRFIDLWSAALGTYTLVPYLAASARRHQTANGVFGTRNHFGSAYKRGVTSAVTPSHAACDTYELNVLSS
jgi:hypothetical protein